MKTMDHRCKFGRCLVFILLGWSTSLNVLAATTGHAMEARQGGGDTHIHNPSQQAIRCWGGETNRREMFDGPTSQSPRDVLEQLANSPCRVCDPRRTTIPRDPQSTASSGLENRYHAVLLYPDIAASEFMALATGLLSTNRFRITIFQIHFATQVEKEPTVMTKDQSDHTKRHRKTSQQEIHDQIMNGLPCDHPARFVGDPSHIVVATLSFQEQKGFNWGKTTTTTTTCDGSLASLQPFHYCTIHAAPATAELLKNHFAALSNQSPNLLPHHQVPPPDVLITDASMMGGLWMSEQWKIPSIVMTNPAYIPLAVEHDVAWTTSQGGNWWNRLGKLWRQRWYSLSLTYSYVEMNKKRSKFGGLSRLRKPMDVLAPVAAILMELAPIHTIPGIDSNLARNSFTETPRQWERLHLLGPMQPPCVPCEIKTKFHYSTSLRAAFRDKSLTKEEQSKKQQHQPVILIVPPTQPTPVATRHILQALIIVRDSLSRYDDCEWDSFSCQKPYTKFKIVWLAQHEKLHHKEDEKVQDDYFPAIANDFMERETSISLLDSVANHPGTILVVMPCDKTTAILEDMLGISTVCIETIHQFPLHSNQNPPSPLEPRVLASKILQQLRLKQQQQHQQQSKDHRLSTNTNKTNTATVNQSSFPEGGLTRAISIVERVAFLHRERQPWRDHVEMQRWTSQGIQNLSQQSQANASTMASDMSTSDWQPPYDNFTVLVAWIILLVSSAYIAMMDLFNLRPNYRRNHHHHHHHSNHYHSPSNYDGMFTRPDMEDARIALLDWYHEQPESWQVLYKRLTGDSSSTNPPLSQGPGSTEATRPTIATPSPVQHNRRRKKR